VVSVYRLLGIPEVDAEGESGTVIGARAREGIATKEGDVSDKRLEGFDDRLARMYLRTLARCIEAEDEANTLAADLAALRAKNEALDEKIFDLKDKNGYLGCRLHDEQVKNDVLEHPGVTFS
jgi:hypothetical protein